MGGPKLLHAGYWAHARRYFFQAVEAHPDDRSAIGLVATIDELFAINAQAREESKYNRTRSAAAANGATNPGIDQEPNRNGS